MLRPILTLPAWLLIGALLVASAPLHGRTLSARIARVATAVAVLEDVEVDLHWPAAATQGTLRLRAARVEAADLGYRFGNLDWQCPLLRDGRGGWRCAGDLRGRGAGKGFRLALDLDSAGTHARLVRGGSRLAVQRRAATPEMTSIDLLAVPLAWAQALSSQAWPDGQLQAGTLDGGLVVRAPRGQPLQVEGDLRLAGGAFASTDATLAAENLGAGVHIDYRRTGPAAGRLAATSVSLDARLHGGQFLFGNTYIDLPSTPVALRVAGQQQGKGGWRLPSVSWDDGTTLQAQGSLVLAPDLALEDMALRVRSADLSDVAGRYLSGHLAAAGLAGLALRGAADLHVGVSGGQLARMDAQLRDVDVRDAGDRFRFDALAGELRFTDGEPVDSQLRWSGGALYGIDFAAATLPLRSGAGEIAILEPFAIPVLGGSLRFDRFALRPPAAGSGLQARFGLRLVGLDVGALAQALGWPAFRGTLDGLIPDARYAGDRLQFDGGLSMQVFDGEVAFSSLSMERPFGVAPTLSADIAIRGLDLLAVTEVFGFGSITGRLDGRVAGLRLVDWSPTTFDARLQTRPVRGVRQRISQRAVQNISSVGDASFVSSLQGQLIGLFDDFGYRRIGISCRLANEVCTMAGLGSVGAGDAAARGFTIVEGAGLPRLSVVGYNRLVDWPLLVERLAAAGSGEVKPVIE